MTMNGSAVSFSPTARGRKAAPPPPPASGLRVRMRSEVRKASRNGATVIQNLPLWSQATRIGGGLTPQQISSIIRQADEGDSRRLIDLENECRQRDAHLQAVLSVNEESIAGLPWQVVAPVNNKGKARAKDKRAAEWIEETLRHTPGFLILLAHLAGAVYYSYAVSEILWEKKAGRMVPVLFTPVAHRRFWFRRSDGAFVFHDEGGPEIELQKAHPNRFIVSFPRVNGDVANREGLGRVLVWMSVMRNWSIGDWLKTGEVSWKPWRIATYKKGTTSHEDRKDLETVMRRLTTDFSAVIPDSCEIAIEWPSGSNQRGSSHAEIVNTLANEMSKAVLGQTETTQASTSSGYAQAKVHDAVRKDIRESRARQVAADVTRDLIAAMVRLNFGPSVAVPRFEFITQDPVDLKAFAEAVKNLREAKAKIPCAWFYEQAGIPEPKEGEPCLGDGEEDEATDGGENESGDNGAPREEEPEPEDVPEAEDTDEPGDADDD